MILTCVIILRFITPTRLRYFLVNFNVTSFPTGKASVISFVMRSISKLCGIFVHNVLKSKLSRCDALRTILTLGAHAQRGLRYLVCECVCVCVCVCVCPV